MKITNNRAMPLARAGSASQGEHGLHHCHGRDGGALPRPACAQHWLSHHCKSIFYHFSPPFGSNLTNCWSAVLRFDLGVWIHLLSIDLLLYRSRLLFVTGSMLYRFCSVNCLGWIANAETNVTFPSWSIRFEKGLEQIVIGFFICPFVLKKVKKVRFHWIKNILVTVSEIDRSWLI
jgi:hypothetical protein